MIRSSSRSGINRYLPAVLLAASLLYGCSAEESARPPSPRLVKVETLARKPPEGLPVLAVVRSRQRTALSFEVDGVLHKLLVQPGQQVTKGQLIAELDRAPAHSRLLQAGARVQARKAAAELAQQELARSKRLLAEGSLAANAVEQAEARYSMSLADLQNSQAQAQAAQRDYRLTQLVAPYDGQIVACTGEPYAHVTAAEPTVLMAAAGASELAAQLPVEQARALRIGARIDAQLAGTPSRRLKLTVRALSPMAEAGVLQEVKFDLPGSETTWAQGTPLALELQLPGADAAFTLPQQAFREAPGQGAQVFVYDPQSASVALRDVEVGGMRGARLIVSKGLAEGEQVVTAGAAFLVDHQAVTLLAEPGKGAGELP